VDLPPAPRGTPQIKVTFDIDANGIVHVSARDSATDNEQSMTITGQSALDRDVIDQMVRDAEAHADEDSLRRKQAEIRNNADNLVYQTQKLLTDQGEQLTDDEKSSVEEKLAALRTALEGDDSDAIGTATEELMTASQEFGQRLYEAAQQEAASAAGGSSGSDDDVVDAEIVDEQ
jgi:molecular chaperone DnaK